MRGAEGDAAYASANGTPVSRCPAAELCIHNEAASMVAAPGPCERDSSPVAINLRRARPRRKPRARSRAANRPSKDHGRRIRSISPMEASRIMPVGRRLRAALQRIACCTPPRCAASPELPPSRTRRRALETRVDAIVARRDEQPQSPGAWRGPGRIEPGPPTPPCVRAWGRERKAHLDSPGGNLYLADNGDISKLR